MKSVLISPLFRYNSMPSEVDVLAVGPIKNVEFLTKDVFVVMTVPVSVKCPHSTSGPRGV